MHAIVKEIYLYKTISAKIAPMSSLSSFMNVNCFIQTLQYFHGLEYCTVSITSLVGNLLLVVTLLPSLVFNAKSFTKHNTS